MWPLRTRFYETPTEKLELCEVRYEDTPDLINQLLD